MPRSPALPSTLPTESTPWWARGWLQGALFAATVLSTFYVGAQDSDLPIGSVRDLLRGWTFAVPLLAILVTHEAGHYLFARVHGMQASLPYFLPMPLPPLGTLGAVIVARDRIRSRNALLDFGAAGPLAGLLVAIPTLIVGLRLSHIGPIPEHGVDEGQCLLYLLLKRIVLGPIPDGHDVFLHPTAFAGWAGLFMTMLNLMPIGQLDGGHVAYALFGDRQQERSRIAHRLLPLVALAVGAYGAWEAMHQHAPWRDVLQASLVGLNWLVWWALLRFVAARQPHPPTEDERPLTPVRRVVAYGTLLLFALLFMPIPLRAH